MVRKALEGNVSKTDEEVRTHEVRIDAEGKGYLHRFDKEQKVVVEEVKETKSKYGKRKK